VQQLPLPLRPHTPDWQVAFALQACPSAIPGFPVLVPPLLVPAAAAPVVVPPPPVVGPEPTVPVVSVFGVVLLEQADPKKMANPAAAVIALRMCKTSFGERPPAQNYPTLQTVTLEEPSEAKALANSRVRYKPPLTRHRQGVNNAETSLVKSLGCRGMSPSTVDGSAARSRCRAWKQPAAVEGTLPRGSIPRRMLIARRSDGRLVFYNAIPLDEEEMRSLEAFGKPSFLVVPNGFHRLDIHGIQGALPRNAALCALWRFARRFATAAAVNGDVTDLPQDPNVSLIPVHGTKIGEPVLVVKSDGTTAIGFGDLLMNLTEPEDSMACCSSSWDRSAARASHRSRGF